MLETLGQYKILDRLGAGGMGEVYRARDMRLGRTVAIKVLPTDVAGDPDRRERFMREARATAALSHPNIAALYEIGEDQGHIFLVFEFVPGDTLKTVIGGRPLNPRRAIDLAVQIADALADAHAEGIVHRDIKPANIIVTPKGAAKILDFGLATWTAGGAERETAATMLATSAGTTLGTVAYMSPEQAIGEPVDHRTDIFSLGAICSVKVARIDEGKLRLALRFERTKDRATADEEAGVRTTSLQLTRLIRPARRVPACESRSRNIPCPTDCPHNRKNAGNVIR